MGAESDEVGQVGATAAELAHGEWPCRVGEVGAQPRLEVGEIESFIVAYLDEGRVGGRERGHDLYYWLSGRLRCGW